MTIPFHKIKHLILFIGMPRCCTSLIASILDAHPQIIVSLRGIRKRSRRKGYKGLVRRIFRYSAKLASENRRHDENEFYMAQWSGTVDSQSNFIVIGVKNIDLLRISRNVEFLRYYIETLNLRSICFLHMIRRPYDVLSTNCYREKMPLKKTIDWMYECYDQVHNLDMQIKNNDKYKMVHFVAEKMFTNKNELRKIFEAVDIDVSSDWLGEVTEQIWEEPRKTANRITWNASDIEKVMLLQDKHKWLKEYDLTDPLV